MKFPEHLESKMSSIEALFNKLPDSYKVKCLESIMVQAVASVEHHLRLVVIANRSADFYD